MSPADRDGDVALFDIDVADDEAAALVSDVLWNSGVLAVEEIALPGGLRLRSSFGVDAQQTARRLGALLADVQGANDSDDLRSPVIDWTVSLVDRDVADSWRHFARPVLVSASLTVVPAWLDDEEDRMLGGSTTRLLIDPGATFGMGDHPTTKGSLRLLERFVRPGSTVLDVGCGSGILGIAALVLGAGSAQGLDINPASVGVSIENAIRNAVEDRWVVSSESLEDVNGHFDLVVANILAPVLVELASDLKRVLAPQGVLVISGVLEGRFDHVIEALSPVQVVESLNVDGWTTIAMTH